MKKRRISVLTVLLAVCAATFAQGLKDVYKQMAANGKFEICALKKSGSEWMRLSGTLVNDETLAVKEEFIRLMMKTWPCSTSPMLQHVSARFQHLRER